MNTRRIAGSFALVVALGLATSCSNDAKKSTDTTAAPIAKADFLAQGNALCTTLNTQLQAASAGITTDAEGVAYLTDSFIPGLRSTLTSIEGLGFPAGDEALMQGLIDQSRAVLDTIEADPAAAVAGDDPFADINQQLFDYGLTVCGQGGQ